MTVMFWFSLFLFETNQVKSRSVDLVCLQNLWRRFSRMLRSKIQDLTSQNKPGSDGKHLPSGPGLFWFSCGIHQISWTFTALVFIHQLKLNSISSTSLVCLQVPDGTNHENRGKSKTEKKKKNLHICALINWTVFLFQIYFVGINRWKGKIKRNQADSFKQFIFFCLNN